MARFAAFEGRAARFALTGLICAALQLALVAAFEAAAVPGLAANALAFGLAAQLNFVLSSRFTWGDRARSGPLAWRWGAFLGAISGTAVLNMAVYALARPLVGDLEAAALGIAAAAIVNFVVGDRAIFRAAPAQEVATENDGANAGIVDQGSGEIVLAPRGVFRG
ncbi:MAG: GtrA family protein [Chloroflexota bacterium]